MLSCSDLVEASFSSLLVFTRDESTCLQRLGFWILLLYTDCIMSLYDDVDAIKQKNDPVAGWSSGIKLFQSQLQLKKAAQTQPKRDQTRKPGGSVLPPVINLKSKKDDEDIFGAVHNKPIVVGQINRDDWQVDGEYDPLWPNDYEKVVIELKEKREREKLKEEDERRKRRGEMPRPPRETNRFEMPELSRPPAEEEEEDDDRMANMSSTPRSGGAAIAPPPSLQEPSTPNEPPSTGPKSVPSFGGGSVAAKIMAKFGYKEGQGLGKKEQGISMALQVEKTSKRGGRIIHEKDIMPPPMFAVPSAPAPQTATTSAQAKGEPSITEIMREPSKVVLLRNMVGPGEVDEDLEPEVKDECNTKYGDVIKVVIYEIPNNPADEAVRIFVEFKRMESAIKAVVDLNGRFFGGRQVKAGFYSWDRLQSLQLLD